MPCYNACGYISEAVESIIGQTYVEWELLIMDDGSTDGTVDQLKEYQDDRISIYHTDQNYGIVYQLNKGINLAKGTLIARMDADDIACNTRLQTQVKYLQDHPDIMVIGTNAVAFGNGSKPMNYPKNWQEVDFLLNYYCCILHPSVMMRKTIFTRWGFTYKEIKYAEDYQLWADLSGSYKMANINYPLLQYRIHNSQTNQKHFLEQYESTKIARQTVLDKNINDPMLRDLINQMANDYLFYGDPSKNTQGKTPSLTLPALVEYARFTRYRIRSKAHSIVKAVDDHLVLSLSLFNKLFLVLIRLALGDYRALKRIVRLLLRSVR